MGTNILPPPVITPAATPPPTSSGTACDGRWTSLLRQIGWPTDVVVLDWETFFSKDYSMSRGKLSTIEYIQDHRFEALGVGCMIMPGDLPGTPYMPVFWHDTQEQIERLQRDYGENLERCTVVGQNLRFDGTILARKHGVVPPYAIDVMNLSAHQDARNTHNLRDMCERWGLPPKGDTEEFLGLHWDGMDDAKRIALSSYCRNDIMRTMDLLAILLPRLTRPEIELPLIRHTLNLFWSPVLTFDAAEADRLIGLMEAQVTLDCDAVGLSPTDISKNLKFTGHLADALRETGEEVPMKRGKRGLITALAKDDDALKDLKVHRNPRVRALIKARQAIKSWPLHIKRVVAMSAQAKAAGGLLPVPLKYYGASTGRWSGGEGLNLQNLPTRGGGLQTEIKHTLRAPDGHVLISGDAAQIEARGLAWLAGQTDLLQAFAEDRDVYSDFASVAFAAPCRKPKKSDPSPVHRLLYGRRFIGKKCILGLGYGMGADRLFESIGEDEDGRPFIESGQVTLLNCKMWVDLYRTKYAAIPKLWRGLEDVFRFTTRYGAPQTLRGLELSRDGTTTVIRLPSGRCLFYPHAAVGVGGDLRYHWGTLWGGTLTENVVQAASRDILAEAILFVESLKFRVALHVHDSILSVVKETEDTIAYACVSEALKRVPAWATGWPMGAEVTLGSRYE